MASSGANPSVQHEKINTEIVTLTRFLTEEQVKHKEATGDFTYVVSALLEGILFMAACSNILIPDSSATPSSSPSNLLPTTSVAPLSLT